MVQALVDALGASPLLKLFDGAVPANPQAADAGSPLVSMALPASAFGAAAAGAVAKAGTWSGVGTAAAGAGTDVTHFRLYTSGGTCLYQGTAGEVDEDLLLDNANVAESQTVTVTTFTITDGNA
jgi:hypothetical protein